MTIIIAALLWILLALVQTMRFQADKSLSEYELNRRIQASDPQAIETIEYRHSAPLLESLRTIVATLIGVSMVTTVVVGFGPVKGILFGAVGLLLSPLVQRLAVFCRLADRASVMVRPYALQVVGAIKPLLSLLRHRESDYNDTKIYSTDEMLDILDRSPHVLSAEQRARLKASLAFDDKTVGGIMTPRTMIDTANVRDSVGPLVLDDLHKTGHSRFPVIDGNIDHVVGMLYLHDLIDLKSGHKTVKSAMSPKVYYVHESQDLSHALHAFLHTHHHLFIVVNDYRETVGLLSLEDVLETLLGKKIVDEFDQFDDLRAVAESNPRKNNVPKGKTDL